MLLSLLLSLTPTVPTHLRGFYGREVQGWLLKEIARHDPDLADAMHADNGMKPYTVSSLIVPNADRRLEDGEIWLMPRSEVLLHITSLEEKLSQILYDEVLPQLPRRLRLKGADFYYLGLVQDNAWWGEKAWGDFTNTNADLSPSVTLEFASPTAFRNGNIDLPLPTPDQVWRSLWWRWNTFAPEGLHIETLWPDFAAACLVVSDFSLRSMKVTFRGGEKGAATGCTGRATYRLLPEKHCGEYALYRTGAEKVLNVLAQFALYSGIGHHTTIGLGQARCLPHPPNSE